MSTEKVKATLEVTLNGGAQDKEKMNRYAQSIQAGGKTGKFLCSLDERVSLTGRSATLQVLNIIDDVALVRLNGVLGSVQGDVLSILAEKIEESNK